ncbi:MAG: YfiR family protein [Thermoanaerobaculia bacterium]
MLAVLLASAVALAAGSKLPPAPGEAELRSAFIYRFTQFVEWPVDSLARTGPTVALCVIGDEALAGALERSVQGKTLDERHYTVLRHGVNDDLRACAVVYFGETSKSATRATLGRLRSAPILTVGEADEFAESGGMIRLFREDARLRFEIDPGAAAASGLKLSAHLLRLARIASRNAPEKH